MPESVISMAWRKLDRFLTKKDDFIPIAESLQDDLEMLMELLHDSGLCQKKLDERSAQNSLMSQARDIAHNADVAIDTFISHVEGNKGVNELREEIRSINRMMRQVTNKVEEAKVIMKFEPEASRGPGRIRIGETADLVGLEDDVRLLLDKAISPRRTRRLSTICIVGMGGIGKTTLASILYNHADVAAHFEVRAWVRVSSDYDQKAVLRHLFEQVRRKEEPELTKIMSDKYVLQNMVHIRLNPRKYFIVLDDVWEKGDVMRNLMNFFPTLGEAASTLLITSRDRKIYERSDFIHEMKLLNPTQSWELFTRKVFPRDHRCPKHLEKIGKQIVAKCDGLPLAIQEAAMQLQEKTQSKSGEEETESNVWEDFLETMDLSVTTETLELSYLNLDRSLKPCFLSLGFFKEGTTMRAQKLVDLWVTGEMVDQGDRESLKDLMDKFLIIVKERALNNRVKSYDINYNVHRLAVKKAKVDMRFEVLTKKTSHDQSSHKPRHRAICCSRENFNYSRDQGHHLVSLFFQGGGNFDGNPTYWESLKLLKILDWEGFGLKTLSIPVEKLISLKYLGLRNNYIQELPQKSDQLKKLEVLDMALNFMIEVPDVIWKMHSLRHLYMTHIMCRKPLKIDGLKNLQTLTYILVENWTYEISNLTMMYSLRKLGIEDMDEKSDIRKLFASLAMLKLKHLILRGFRFRSMPDLQNLLMVRRLKILKLDGLLVRLPNAKSFPPKIKSLSLLNSRLDEDPMPILEKLSKLKYLRLQNAYSGKQMVISRHGFAELRNLCIEELWHLRSIQVEKGALKELKRLEIINCMYLNTLPEEIGSMRKLMELKMVTTRRIATMIRKSSFVSKIQKVDIEP